MKRLTAIYKIRLDNPLVIKRRDGEFPTYKISVDSFDASIRLTDQFMAGVRSRTERLTLQRS